jgi:uncharacterized protein YqeY
VAPQVTSFAVKFLGCKVSQADAMLARDALLAAGHTEVAQAEAELHVINTCCITGEAEAKSRQSVRRSLATAAEVYVAGCAANLDAAQFAAIDPRVRPFVGSADDVAAELGACADVEHDVLARQPVTESARTRGFVKVQDGCDSACAYCIIPSVRGPARSRPASAVLSEVRRRVARGQPEMVMTGISVGDYRDPEQGLELGELMAQVARVPGVERVRLSSVEVIHVKDSLLDALAHEPRVCPHLHVPMQSGDDDVLRGMGRHYTAAEYVARCSACWSTRSPIHSAPATRRTTRGATCRPVPLAGARWSTSSASSCMLTGCGAPKAILRRVTIIDQVRGDMTTAMKAGEKERVGALRLVLSELQKAVKDDSGDELSVLRRERKRRLDAAEQYHAASRPELAQHEEFEARLIETYLPAELDDAALDEMIGAVIAEVGATDVKDMGQVMKGVMARGGGRLDGKRASARVREALRA